MCIRRQTFNQIEMNHKNLRVSLCTQHEYYYIEITLFVTDNALSSDNDHEIFLSTKIPFVPNAAILISTKLSPFYITIYQAHK